MTKNSQGLFPDDFVYRFELLKQPVILSETSRGYDLKIAGVDFKKNFIKEKRAKRKQKLEAIKNLKTQKAQLKNKQNNLKESLAFNIPLRENKNQENIKKLSSSPKLPSKIEGKSNSKIGYT